MKKVYFELESLDKIHEAARYFLNAVGDANIFAIDGDMGVGKTTFIKAVCEELGVKDVITSPTFSLVNEYTDGKGEPVYHFDFYRIKKIADHQVVLCRLTRGQKLPHHASEPYKPAEKKLLAGFVIFPCHIFAQFGFFLLLCKSKE